MEIAESAEVYIARASIADAYDLTCLRAASLVEMGLMQPSERDAFLPRAHREFVQLLREERFAAWLLVSAGRPAGCAGVLLWQRVPYPTTSLHAEVAGVYVEPALRGQGYAREMVSEAISWARASQPRRVVLHVNPAARSLYERLGFVDGSEMRLA
ncbi:GNAT family N-acetyltransferase [bacterium]|nr:MAG: GNAT family N-acetyltransferase [bacterium]